MGGTGLLCIVEEGASAGARRKELAEERGTDDADKRLRGVHESERNAAHWEGVYVVDGPVEGLTHQVELSSMR
jgi:hypothetical protein